MQHKPRIEKNYLFEYYPISISTRANSFFAYQSRRVQGAVMVKQAAYLAGHS